MQVDSFNFNDFVAFRDYCKGDVSWKGDAPKDGIYKVINGVLGKQLLCYWEGADRFREELEIDGPAKHLFNKGYAVGFLTSFGYSNRIFTSYLFSLKYNCCLLGIHKKHLNLIKTPEDLYNYRLFFLTHLQDSFSRYGGPESDRPYRGYYKERVKYFPKWYWEEQRHLFTYYSEHSRHLNKAHHYYEHPNGTIYPAYEVGLRSDNYNEYKHKSFTIEEVKKILDQTERSKEDVAMLRGLTDYEWDDGTTWFYELERKNSNES